MTESNKVCYYNNSKDVLVVSVYIYNVFFPSGLAVDRNGSIAAQNIM